MINMSAKFDEDAHSGLVSILQLVTDRRMHNLTTEALLCPLSNTFFGDNHYFLPRRQNWFKMSKYYQIKKDILQTIPTDKQGQHKA